MSADTAIKSVGDIEAVVDSDFHLTESPEDILPYLEDPWNEMLSTDPDTYGGWANIYPDPATVHPGIATGRIEVRTVDTPDDVREGMEKLGVDEPILTPGRDLLLGSVHHDELAGAIASAYNDWVSETFLGEGFKATMIVAPHRPALAAEEIRARASDSGFVAVLVPSAGAFPPLGHDQYFPVYEACEEAGLPLLIHGSASAAWVNFPHLHQGLRRHLSLHTVVHPVEHMMHLTSMVTNGVPVRYPSLDVVFQESGLGWIPFLMYRLDHEYPMKPEDAPLLDERPSEYIKENFYFTSQPVEGIDKPEYVANTVRAFDGAENLLFASDYPHHDFDNSNELLHALRGEFADEEIRDIYGGNATTVFDL